MSMLESVKGMYLGVPLATRSWASLSLALAGLSQAGLLQPEAVQLDGALIVSKFQLWRPLTAASFFGGIGAQLLQKLYYLVSHGRQLEQTLGLAEYVRAVVSMVAMLTFCFHLLGWPLTGDGVVMAITVLCAMQDPDAQMNMYGLKFPVRFLPFAQLTMSYLFTQQIPWPDIGGMFVGYVHYWMCDNLKPDAAVAGRLPVPATGGAKGGRKLGGGGKPAAGGSGGGRRKSRIATMNDVAACGPGG